METAGYSSLRGDEMQKHRWRNFVVVLAFITIWWTTSVGVVMLMNQTVSYPYGLFPHPFAFTSLTQFVTGFAAWLISKALRRRLQKLTPLSWREIVLLVLVGILMGGEIALTNKALGYLTVAARTMLSGMGVLCVMATARLWNLERLGSLRLLSGALLALGGVALGLAKHSGEGSSHTLGVWLQVFSMLIAAQRWALMQFILQRSPSGSTLGQMFKIEILVWAMISSGVVCVPCALVFERGAYTELFNLQGLTHVLANLIGIPALLCAMLCAELKLVSLLSAVAFSVLGTVHQIPTVLAGVVFLHNRTHRMSCFGFGLCIAGALVYAGARHLDESSAEGNPRERQKGGSQVDG